MYIEKRWLLPAMLTVAAAAGLLIVLALALRPPATTTRVVDRVVDVTPTNAACPPAAAAAPTPVTPASVAGNNTQINTRGFGDIGMQLQNVDVNAPITNIHISNTASGPGSSISNNVNVGAGNTITAPAEPAGTSAGASTPASTPSSSSTTGGTSGASTTGAGSPAGAGTTGK